MFFLVWWSFLCSSFFLFAHWFVPFKFFYIFVSLFGHTCGPFIIQLNNSIIFSFACIALCIYVTTNYPISWTKWGGIKRWISWWQQGILFLFFPFTFFCFVSFFVCFVSVSFVCFYFGHILLLFGLFLCFNLYFSFCDIYIGLFLCFFCFFSLKCFFSMSLCFFSPTCFYVFLFGFNIYSPLVFIYICA